MPTLISKLLRILMSVGIFMAIVHLNVGIPLKAQDTRDRPLKGMNIYFHGHDAYRDNDLRWLLDELDSMKISEVILNIPIFIDRWNGNDIGFVTSIHERIKGGYSPTPDEVMTFVDAADRHGMTVMLRPFLEEGSIRESGGTWRGAIEPSDPSVFFNNYQSMLAELLPITQSDVVTGLIFGSEMSSLEAEKFDGYWVSIIQWLKDEIGGGTEITYAVNWDAGYNRPLPKWISRLDAVAIDAYFPILGFAGTPPAAEIALGLALYEQRLQNLKLAVPGGRMYVTEFGLSSQGDATNTLQEPWQSADETLPVNLNLQANYLQAGCDYFGTAIDGNGDRLADGLYFWIATVNRLQAPQQDRGFEMVGKPGQQVIMNCWVDKQLFSRRIRYH